MFKKTSLKIGLIKQSSVKKVMGGMLLMAAFSVQAGVQAPVTSVGDSAEVKLALDIVHKYRDLRARCHSLPNDQKNMCFYRMKIGNWDYREAKLILAKHKLI